MSDDNRASCGCPTYWVEHPTQPEGQCPYCRIAELEEFMAEQNQMIAVWEDADIKQTRKISELEAELEKWKALASQITTDWIPANQAMSAEVSSLRSEVERLAIYETAWQDERDLKREAVAEVERLNKTVSIQLARHKEFQMLFDELEESLRVVTEEKVYYRDENIKLRDENKYLDEQDTELRGLLQEENDCLRAKLSRYESGIVTTLTVSKRGKINERTGMAYVGLPAEMIGQRVTVLVMKEDV